MITPVRSFLPDKAAHRLGFVTGAVMFTFVSMHLANHALLIVSDSAADAALRIFKILWRNPLGAMILYGSFMIHFLLALRILYLRRHLGRPLVMMQLVFGLSLPFLIAQHVVSVRIPTMFNGSDGDYAAVLRGIWSNRDMMGVKIVAAVIVAWMHGCIGIHATARYRRWFPRAAQFLFAVAVIVPTLALTGVFVAGQRLQPDETSRLEELMSLPEELGVAWAGPAHQLDLKLIELRFQVILAIGLILVIGFRGARWFRRSEPEIVVTYVHGPQVRVPRGTSILEASRVGHIDHYSICGGKGRCSTCRVRITETAGPLPRPSSLEQATLARVKAATDVRLSCQTRPDYDVTVALQLEPPVGGSLFSDHNGAQVGREKEILVMFSDLRNFTAISETRLPYDIVFVLNSYFSIVVQAVEAAGGRVDKYIGDGVMALFGIDGQRDAGEICRNALAAAARIVAETQKLNQQLMQEFGIDLQVAIGIHYGPAIVGMLGYGKVAALTAIGDTVNVASRLESVAKQFDAAVAASQAVMLLAGVPHEGVPTQRVPLRGRRLDMPVVLLSAEQAARYA